MNTVPDEIGSHEESVEAGEALAQARARRLAALKAAVGLWKDRNDIPKDGVKAQEELRAEWH